MSWQSVCVCLVFLTEWNSEKRERERERERARERERVCVCVCARAHGAHVCVCVCVCGGEHSITNGCTVNIWKNSSLHSKLIYLHGFLDLFLHANIKSTPFVVYDRRTLWAFQFWMYLNLSVVFKGNYLKTIRFSQKFSLKAQLKYKITKITNALTRSSFLTDRNLCQFSKRCDENSAYIWCRELHSSTAAITSVILSLASTMADAASLMYFVKLSVDISFSKESSWLHVNVFCETKYQLMCYFIAELPCKENIIHSQRYNKWLYPYSRVLIRS